MYTIVPMGTSPLGDGSVNKEEFHAAVSESGLNLTDPESVLPITPALRYTNYDVMCGRYAK